MNEILVVPDIHGRNFLEKIVDFKRRNHLLIKDGIVKYTS
jgi:hypothetical protein